MDALKLIKSKAVLIIKDLSPQSLRDTTTQIYCTSLEPNRGLGQGADLSIPTAISYTLPHAESLYDIGVRISSAGATAVTRLRAVIADFKSFQRGLVFNALQITAGVNE